MKKSFITKTTIFGSLILLNFSCADDNLTDSSNEMNTLSKEQREVFNAKLDSTLVNMYSKNIQVSSRMSLALPQASYDGEGEIKTAYIGKSHLLAAVNSVIKEMRISATPRFVGPIESQAVPNIHQRNRRIILTPENGYPTTGVYFADILIYKGSAFAPANAVGGYVDERDTSSSPWGWGYKTDDGFIEANRGVTVTQSRQGGNRLYLTANSYSAFVRSNILGQGMGGYHRPVNFRGKQVAMVYKFYYIVL